MNIHTAAFRGKGLASKISLEASCGLPAFTIDVGPKAETIEIINAFKSARESMNNLSFLERGKEEIITAPYARVIGAALNVMSEIGTEAKNAIQDDFRRSGEVSDELLQIVFGQHGKTGAGVKSIIQRASLELKASLYSTLDQIAVDEDRYATFQRVMRSAREFAPQCVFQGEPAQISAPPPGFCRHLHGTKSDSPKDLQGILENGLRCWDRIIDNFYHLPKGERISDYPHGKLVLIADIPAIHQLIEAINPVYCGSWTHHVYSDPVPEEGFGKIAHKIDSRVFTAVFHPGSGPFTPQSFLNRSKTKAFHSTD